MKTKNEIFENIKSELAEKLQKVQSSLKDRELGIGRLEVISADMKKAFDKAIENLAEKRDMLKELKMKRDAMKKWRISIFETLWPINWFYVLSAPFIYGAFIPFVIFHLGLEIYHRVCFSIYRIPRVRARDYFIFDRQLLPYLNWFEKFNCIYCSYANNLLRYAMEISGRTERYWCPIKYHKRVDGAHSQYDKFVDFLDAENFRDKWHGLRNFSDVEERRQGQEEQITDKDAAVIS